MQFRIADTVTDSLSKIFYYTERKLIYGGVHACA
jgi:hypothetical protein